MPGSSSGARPAAAMKRGAGRRAACSSRSSRHRTSSSSPAAASPTSSAATGSRPGAIRGRSPNYYGLRPSSSSGSVPELMRIALCNEVIAPMPFPRQCEYAAKLGYDGLEIAPYTLSDEPHRLGAAQLAAARAAAQDAGIALTGLHWLLLKPAGLSICSKDDGIRKKTVTVMLAL